MSVEWLILGILIVRSVLLEIWTIVRTGRLSIVIVLLVVSVLEVAASVLVIVTLVVIPMHYY